MFGLLQSYVLLGLQVLVLVVCVIGFIDALRRPAAAFTAAGKMTRTRWALILGIASAVALVGVNNLGLLMLTIIAAVAGIVYMVDVRPAVAPYSGRGGRGGQNRGGW